MNNIHLTIQFKVPLSLPFSSSLVSQVYPEDGSLSLTNGTSFRVVGLQWKVPKVSKGNSLSVSV